jgi:hypothetical protein
MMAAMSFRLAPAVLAMPLLAGCLTGPTQEVDLGDVSVFDAYRGGGPGTVVGQAFIRRDNGSVVTCAGDKVLLIPYAGGFSKAWDVAQTGVQPVSGSGRRISEMAGSDPRFSEIVRRSQCDAQGNFRFNNVPVGRWVVFTQVTWEADDVRRGGGIGRRIAVTGAKPVEVLVTNADRN